MGFLVLEGDLTSTTEGFGATTVPVGLSTGSLNSVFVNNIGVVCEGDAFSSHSNTVGVSHIPIAGSSGSKVFIGPASKEAFTTLSPMAIGCSDYVLTSTSTILAGQ